MSLVHQIPRAGVRCQIDTEVHDRSSCRHTCRRVDGDVNHLNSCQSEIVWPTEWPTIAEGGIDNKTPHTTFPRRGDLVHVPSRAAAGRLWHEPGFPTQATAKVPRTAPERLHLAQIWWLSPLSSEMSTVG
jgi:hypothetical protein